MPVRPTKPGFCCSCNQYRLLDREYPHGLCPVCVAAQPPVEDNGLGRTILVIGCVCGILLASLGFITLFTG